MTISTGFHGMNLGMDIVKLKGSTSNTDSILQVGIAKNGRRGTLKNIRGGIKAYHVTTQKKLDRYKKTGAILPPVRFWKYENSAREWMKRTSRNILIEFNVDEFYPLPDHKPRGHAFWSPEIVRDFKIIMECDIEKHQRLRHNGGQVRGKRCG